jgi:hypothetical protein
MVGLAFDFQVDEAVRVRERRVEELEEELRRRGIEVGEDEDDDEEMGEAAAGGSGTRGDVSK